MTPTQTVLLIVVMILLVAYSNWNQNVQRGYACPTCGTQREDKHADGCPMKK